MTAAPLYYFGHADGAAARAYSVRLADGVGSHHAGRLNLYLHGGDDAQAPAFSDDDPRCNALPSWLDPGGDAEWIREWTRAAATLWAGMPATDVHVFPRGALDARWWRRWYHVGDAAAAAKDPFPGPLAFRASAWGVIQRVDEAPVPPRVILVADRAETPDSFTWLLGHELAHVAACAAPYVRFAFDVWRLQAGLPADVRFTDSAHDADPEEQWCNSIGTALAGGRYDRAWWRERLRTIPMVLRWEMVEPGRSQPAAVG